MKLLTFLLSMAIILGSNIAEAQLFNFWSQCKAEEPVQIYRIELVCPLAEDGRVMQPNRPYPLVEHRPTRPYKPYIEIRLIDGDNYIGSARNEASVLAVLLQAQRTDKERYSPDRIKRFAEYLINELMFKMWEGYRFWESVISRRSSERIFNLHGLLNSFQGDYGFISDYSQTKLDEIYDWLINSKVGKTVHINRFWSCPINGDLTPLLESTEECAIWSNTRIVEP